LTAGPIARLRFGRKADTGSSPFLIAGETDDLLGLEDIPAAAELGGFAQYSRGQFSLKGDIRRGFGGHEGVVADFSAQVSRRSGDVAWSFGPRTTLAGARYVDVYFGVDPAGAASSGLPAFEARGGVVSFGAGGSAVHPLTDNAALTFFAGYDRLAGDAARSPIVEMRGERDQFSLGVAFGYRFGWGGRE
jgi:outer membrane scaffolding protein for murein synthesis (MipA/OmpV family)